MNVWRVSKDCPECSLHDTEGSLSSKVPSSSIRAATLEVKPVLMDESTVEQFRIPHRSMNNKYK